MDTAKNTIIMDAVLVHTLDLLQLNNRVRRKVLVELEALRKDIIKRLDQGTLTEYTKKRLNSLLADINATTAIYYGKAEAATIAGTEGVATVTAQATAAGLNQAFGFRIDSAMPTERVLGLLNTNVMIQGMPSNKWWAKQKQDTVFRFQSSIRRGIMTGSTNQQIIRDIGDEIGISRRHVSTLVHSAVQTVSNEARLATFRENDDILKGLEYIATLDSLTCRRCAARDKLTWDFEGKPIGGHGITFKNPQLHFGCRCVLTPVTKTFKELGFDIPDLPPITRASEVGPISGNIDFDAFLKRQGKKFQNDVLGPGRADLWRKKKITLLDLISAQGKELTLEQIRKKI